MTKKLRTAAAMILLFGLLCSLPLSAASSASSDSVGGEKVECSVSCTAHEASALITTNTRQSAVTCTLKLYYVLNASGRSEIYASEPVTVAGNGAATVTVKVPDSRYMGYRAIVTYTACINGEYWESEPMDCYWKDYDK